MRIKKSKINNPAASSNLRFGGVCCSNKILHSEFNTTNNAPRLPRIASSWVLNLSARIKNYKKIPHRVRIFLKTLITPIIAVLFLVFLIFLLSGTPYDTLYFFFIGPFRNLFNFGNMLNASVPYIFGALGIIIAMKAGNLNLGGEGQIYLGSAVTVVTALSLSGLGAAGAVIAAAAGALSAGVLGALSGFCRAKWNTNEMITTFLLSCAVIPFVNYLVTGLLLDPGTSLLSTEKVSDNMRLPLILKPSSLSAGLLISFVFVLAVSFFLNGTRTGYEFRMAGYNDMFARYGGINTKFNTVLSLALSGFLYGLAGSVLVLGTHYAVIKEFSAGIGWNGLTTALIAGFSPAAVIPCAFFLAWINSGARIAMQNTGLAFEVAYIAQAALFILSTSAIIKKSFNIVRKG